MLVQVANEHAELVTSQLPTMQSSLHRSYQPCRARYIAATNHTELVTSQLPSIEQLAAGNNEAYIKTLDLTNMETRAANADKGGAAHK